MNHIVRRKHRSSTISQDCLRCQQKKVYRGRKKPVQMEVSDLRRQWRIRPNWQSLRSKVACLHHSPLWFGELLCERLYIRWLHLCESKFVFLNQGDSPRQCRGLRICYVERKQFLSVVVCSECLRLWIPHRSMHQALP